MHIFETLKLAIAAIWAHKLRSFLTLLGMIIGVMAFVIVVSLIQGFNIYFDEKVANIGAKAFTIQRFGFDDFKDTDTIAAAQRRNKDLTLDEFDYIRTRAVLIDKIGAKARPMRAEIKRGSESLQDVQIDGATPVIADIEKIEVADGRYFVDSENEAGARVAFVGADIATRLFGRGSAVGQEITITGIPYRIVGVAVAKGTIFGRPMDYFVTLPLRTYAKHFGGLVRQRSLLFEGTSINDAVFNDAVDEARFLLRAYRRIPPGEKDNFGIVTPDAIMGIRDRILGMVSLVAMSVPAIALVIGGIVIMNIMLVSVTERTREIGIRKSLGARRKDILRQFLVESATLAAIGGALGIFLAWTAGKILTALFFPTYLSLVAIAITLTFSGGIGMVFGLYPAWKAAKLDPIEALRYE